MKPTRLQRRKLESMMISKMNVTIVVLVLCTYMIMTNCCGVFWHSGSMMTLAQKRRFFRNMMNRLQMRFFPPAFVDSFYHLSHSYCDFVLKLNAYFQGLTLDARGRFTGEAEKKLEEVIFSWQL